MARRRLGTTLWNLFLALLNATLLLAALCLFLSWKVAAEVDDITDDFARNLVSLAPLREDVQAMTAELAELRADLDLLRGQAGQAQSSAALAVQDRLDALETRFSTMADGVEALVSDPQILIDMAVDSTARELKQGIADLRGCTLPEGS